MRLIQKLFLLFALFLSIPCEAKLTAQWLGIAGLEISDGETSIVFDPVITKPQLFKHWIFNSELLPDPQLVELLVSKLSHTSKTAIFLSHTHFDHSLDAPAVAKAMNAQVYGGVSVKNLLTYFKIPNLYSEMKDGEPLMVGKFTIIPYRRKHSDILGLFSFLGGELKNTFSAKFYDYREGETWSFRVEHPESKMLVDQASKVSDRCTCYAGKTDFYFVGVANKKSAEAFVKQELTQIKPKKVLPLHYDFFLLDNAWLDEHVMPYAMRLLTIKELLHEQSPDTQWFQPKMFEKIDVN